MLIIKGTLSFQRLTLFLFFTKNSPIFLSFYLFSPPCSVTASAYFQKTMFIQNKEVSFSRLKERLMARNFYWSTFFGHIFNLNNLKFIKARILRKDYFNRSRFCFLDFTITSNLEKYF
jgi:hypothetical protein